jgi:membrane-associated phospholipid phosphatase
MHRTIWLALLLLALPVSSQNADIRLLRAIYSSEKLPTDPIFEFLTDSYPVIVAGTPLVLGVTALLTDDDGMLFKSLEIGTATILNIGATTLLKYTIRRDRPYTTYADIIPKELEDSPSFPSYHTSAAFTTATSLSLSYPRWYVIAPTYLWACSVGYSRLYLGAHYPSDVFCGALLGAGSAWVTHRISRWYQDKQLLKHGKYE